METSAEGHGRARRTGSAGRAGLVSVVLALSAVLTGCGSSGASAPPAPHLNQFIPNTSRVVSVTHLKMAPSGPDQVIVMSVGQPDAILNDFVPERLEILSWDSFANRWSVAFDSSTSSAASTYQIDSAPTSQSGIGASGGPTNEMARIQSIKLGSIADQADGAQDLTFTATPFSASGGGLAGIIHYSNDTAQVAWLDSSGYAGMKLQAAGTAPHQTVVLTDQWETAADPHCCALRSFHATLTPKSQAGGYSFVVTSDNRPWLGAWLYWPQSASSTPADPIVVATVAGSPAAAELKPGDVLVNVSGASLPKASDLAPFIIDEVGLHYPGHRISLSIERGGQNQEVQMTLGSRADERAVSAEPPQLGSLGVDIATMTPSLAAENSLPDHQGALVLDVTSGSAAESAGLQAGDIITQLGGITVNNDDDLVVADAAVGEGNQAAVTYVAPDGTTQSAEATLGLPAAQQDVPIFYVI